MGVPEPTEGPLDAARLRARRAARGRALARRRALIAGCLLVAIGAVAAVVALAGRAPAGGGSASRSAAGHAARGPAGRTAHDAAGAVGPASGGASTGRALAGGLRSPRAPAPVPILMYHVINTPPPGAPFPGLYVPPGELAEQLKALARAGFHAVTMDQLWANWHEGAALPAGRPIVLSFDNGYQSQYTQALPILRRLGWAGVENLQLTGLPPSQGGLSPAQVRGLVAAGWELDTQGFSHADLIALGSADLHYQVAVARTEIRRLYGVAANWFCYPSGHYDATVIVAVRSAGYRGSTTVVPGWASPGEDPYRLPRLRVLGGTGPQELLSEIAAIRDDPAPPPSYG